MIDTLSTRLKARIKELSMTQENVAAAMGLTRGAITHYLSGRRIPPLKQFEKLASILKVDAAWLQYGIDANTTLNSEAPTTFPLPILTWDQVSRTAKYDDLTNSTHNFSEFSTQHANWYALYVRGDAMTASTSQGISFHANDLIIVDPTQTAKHGDYVIATLGETGNEVTFKQYVKDGGVDYLKPLNPQYPLITCDQHTRMIGKVVKLIKQTDGLA